MATALEQRKRRAEAIGAADQAPIRAADCYQAQWTRP